MSSLEPLIAEAQRMLRICNACRYCEGYCAVFPALERRLDFGEADVHYLANLCHNCGSCLYACQYAPPHEFQLNFPRMLAEVRLATYRKYALPGLLFARGAALLTLASLLVLFFLVDTKATGSFYDAMPHSLMAGFFGIVSLLILVPLVAGGLRFWRDMGERAAGGAAEGARDALTLKYLGGGGEGCTWPDERPSFARRRFHHLTFYGFLLCFAATCVGTFYHYVLGWPAPYPLLSLPVIFGTLGGMGLIAGPAGLLYLRSKREADLADPRQDGIDLAFITLLFLTGATGLALLALRDTPAMATLLAVHLGVVLALFLTLPYGKFVHAVYRLAALVRYHVERKRPPPALGGE
jgi:citrate/tricarballylate utilization protein